jgi:alkylated DNA nucleotide flippase Atl1
MVLHLGGSEGWIFLFSSISNTNHHIYIIHANPDGEKYPCYKVVNAKGMLSEHYAFGGLSEQKRRLEQDGIEVSGYRVDLKKHCMHCD